MSMVVDLSNKVIRLEQATHGLATLAIILSAVHLHDLKNTTQQAACPTTGSRARRSYIWRWTEQWLRQIPLLQAIVSQGDSSSEEELVVKRKNIALKSDRDHTGAISVKKIIT